MKRVVITGIGGVTPCGNSKEEILRNIEEKKLGIEPSHLETASFYGKVDPSCLESLTKKQKRYMDKASQFAYLATKEAIIDSKLDQADIEDATIYVGTSMGGFETLFYELTESAKNGLDKMTVLGIPKSLHNMVGTNISIEFGIKGGIFTYNSACASSAMAIGEAFSKIRNGDATVCVTGGTESCIIDQVFESFNRLGALSTSTDLNKASIPFSSERQGFVLSEGASFLILEEYEHAIKRNADIYCEISGYGTSSDAKSLVSPDLTGIKKCIENSLMDAQLSPNDIEYINAHGTSTVANDVTETKAISEIFLEKGSSPLISSTKSFHGHLLGAAGAMEALLCTLMIRTEKLFSQRNVTQDKIDESMNGLNFILDGDANYQGGAILSNSFAFGGINVSLVFSKSTFS